MPQLKQACFEIVCWDSTCLLLIGVPDKIAKEFLKTYSDTIDLDEFNKSKRIN